MSDLRKILSKLRKYEIRIRKAVTAQMQGDFHSVFKGSGLEFDDVRQYQYGDDVRTVNWNVSAKGHGVYVNTFREDKEQNIFFILDVSASQELGKQDFKKIDIAREICGVLALSAIKESSAVSLLAFSDRKEVYVPAGKGPKHSTLIVKALYDNEPKSRETDLEAAIKAAMQLMKRKSLVILISDFIDDGYEKTLRGLALKHDLVTVHLADVRERKMPKLGIIPLLDKESGRLVWFNTSSRSFRKSVKSDFEARRELVSNACRRYNANYLFVDTNEDFVPQLIRLFKHRSRIKR